MSNKNLKRLKNAILILLGSGGLIQLLILFKPSKDSQNTDIKSSIKKGVVANISNIKGSVYINNGFQDEKINISKESVPVAAEREIFGRSKFLSMCEYGDIAVLPDAKTRSEAVSADNFLILSREGEQHNLNNLNSKIWLQFNHYLPGTNGKRRHLGIFIVTFGRMGATMPLEVYRNKNWVRPESKKILGQFSEVVELPWKEYVSSVEKWSSSNAKLSDVDQTVKGPWHAIPEGGDKFSWQYRDFWKWAVTNCQKTAKKVLGPSVNFENVKVSARLIRYSPIPKPVSNSPVLFDIRSMYQEKTAAFIAIYALEDSGQDIRQWYWIKRE